MAERRPDSKAWYGWAIVAALDVVAVALGMGVPALAILFGFPVGWYAARRAGLPQRVGTVELRNALVGSAAVAGLTLLMMLGIWGPQALRLSEPGFDAAKWGIPLILYTSTPSFVGWLVLMIVISPALQLLCSVSAAYFVAMRQNQPTMESSAQDTQ